MRISRSAPRAAGADPCTIHTPAALYAGRLHAPELVLEFLDLVPQPGRDLELELRRCRVHLIGELLYERRQIPARRALSSVRRVAAARAARRRPRPRGKPGNRRLAPGLLAPAADQLLGVRVLTDDLVQDVGNALAQRLGVHAVGGVVRDLLLTPAVGLVDRVPHGRRDLVRVHVDLTGDVTRRPADRLDQRGGRAQKAFLVRV